MNIRFSGVHVTLVISPTDLREAFIGSVPSPKTSSAST